jgi:hypothetical protein
MRFCPFDAEELGHDWQEASHAEDHEHAGAGEGKICPVCASRYDLDAQICGRDGSELVTVN